MLEPGWAGIIAGWAAGKPAIREVHLYGSRVKGTSTSESDLDVALLIDSPAETSLTTWIFEGREWAEELDALLPVQVHLEMMDIEDRVVWPAVREHGQLVYRR